MFLKLFVFVVLCIHSIFCQKILDQIKDDPRGSQFGNFVSSISSLQSFFNNPFLTVFVPSNEAMNAINLNSITEKENLVKAHMYDSTPIGKPSVMGTTSNWAQYRKVTVGSNIFNYRPSIGDINRLYMSSAMTVNEAKVTAPDQINGTQVYHIIDRVMINYQFSPFIVYLRSNPDLKTSFDFWIKMEQASEKGLIPTVIGYNKNMMETSLDNTITMLVPSNAAWASLRPDELERLNNNITELGMVLNRHFLPQSLLFLRGDNVLFKAGFLNSAQVSGAFTSNLQVNVQEFSGAVTKPNIPIEFGVVHIIGDPLYKKRTPAEYLSENNKAFTDKLTAFNMSQFLTANYTIMAPDDPSVFKITDDSKLKEALQNSFIVGNAPLTSSRGMMKTVGGLNVRLRETDGNYYLDVLQSLDNNTWRNSVPVKNLNQMVGSSSITLLGGILTNDTRTCDDMFVLLNGRNYKNLVYNNKIRLDRGSPYTILMPTDEALRKFNQENSTSETSSMMKYLLQRMIIANDMNLYFRPPATFKAATMNYAAMLEWLNVTSTKTMANISLDGTSGSFNLTYGGYICYMLNKYADDTSRFNLIYPVPFVLPKPLSTPMKICVEPPCDGAVWNHWMHQWILLAGIIVLGLCVRP